MTISNVRTSLPKFVTISAFLFFGLHSLTASATGGWEQEGDDINGEATGDGSGYSVSTSSDGNTIAIGAPFNDGSGNGAGHVRVYAWNGSSWTQRGVDIDGEAASDQFGYSVSLSADGNTVAVGARGNDGNGSDSGHARIYTWNSSWNNNTGRWEQRGNDIDGEAASDQFGYSVSLSADGNTVAVGAYLNDGNGADSGHTRVYTWNGSAWTQRGADIDGEAAGDASGVSVSLSADGNTVAVGAPFGDESGIERGHTRIYTWNSSWNNNTGRWEQRGNDIDGEAADDRSGVSVSLSDDGNSVAIGAFFNDGNGADSGHTRVYTWNGSAWTQRGNDINGEAADDWSGVSVSLSADGKTVAVGAYRNDGNGADSGHTRVYTWNGSAWTQRGGDIDGASFSGSGFSVALSDDGTAVVSGQPYAPRGLVRIFRFPFPTLSSQPAPFIPLWRVSLDANGGTCVVDGESVASATSVPFLGYRYIPSSDECTKPGHTFAGWANKTDPTTVVKLPRLIDLRDNTWRYFIADNHDLVAVWTAS